jgi:hypothetical protein
MKNLLIRRTDAIIDSDDEIDGFQVEDKYMAAELGELLVKHYPGYFWLVHVDSRPHVGMVYIKNGFISNHFGMKLHLKTVLEDPDRKCVINMAGELLERAGLPRGRHDGETVAEEVEGLPGKYQPQGGVVI